MYIEAVTTCVNYSDLLDLSIAENKRHFDRWVIVTTPNDTKTQELCQAHDVECLQADVFGPKFNQCKAINFGIKNISKQGWILSLDADILLPRNAKEIIEKNALEENILYGVPRINLTLGDCKYVNWITNWASMRNDAPVNTMAGYFHLFHNSSFKPYYEELPTVADKDFYFQSAFESWGVMPMYVFHFGESNWAGRESPIYPEFSVGEKEAIYYKLEEVNK